MAGGHDVSGEARDDHGRWVAAFTDWHEQAGATANSKPREKHEAEAAAHRERLLKLPAKYLKAIAEEIGYFARKGTTREQFVDGLIATVSTRRGMAQRTEMSIRRPWVSKGFGRFDESKHPRRGGKFAPKGGGTAPKATPVSRHNPDLDAFMAAHPSPPAKPPTDIRAAGPDIFAEHGTEPARHPSAHNPAITYGHAEDRDSDDKHFAGLMRSAARNVNAAKRKLAAKVASDPTDTPAIRVLRAKLAQHTAKVEALKQRAAAAAKPTAKPRASKPLPGLSTPWRPNLAERIQNRDVSGVAQEQRPAPIPLERIGGASPPAPGATQRGQSQPPALPHHRTQAAALDAARQVQPGDHASHQRAVQALDAHYAEGKRALQRMAQERHGDSPRAKRAYAQALGQWRQKMSAARAKIDTLAGRGPPPVPRRPGQGPPPLADRGRIRPWVSMKSYGSAELLTLVDLDPLPAGRPWVFKTRDASGHEHASDGRFGTVAGQHGGKKKPAGKQSHRDKVTASPSFRQWFGDSKVVDADGKPLVVYHGTSDEFNQFDTEGGKDLGGFGYGGSFFAADPDVAASYSYHMVRADKQATKERDDAEDARDDYWQKLADKTGTNVPSERVVQRWLNDLLDEGKITREEYDKADELEMRAHELGEGSMSIGDDDPRKPNIHPVYLNIRNPKVIDANGMNWDIVVPRVLEKVDRKKHDGVIFRNIKDSGDESQQTTTTFFVFDPKQIKSATGNAGTFDPNDPDTRKSARPWLVKTRAGRRHGQTRSP